MADGYRFLSVPYDSKGTMVIDKERSVEEFATYFLLRCMKMFHYEGLPEEIPEDCLHKQLLTEGFGWFTKWNATFEGKEGDQFYFFNARMGDKMDAYYRPSGLIVSNPGANCYEEFMLGRQKKGTYYGEKGVIIRNDTLYHGLMPLINRYSYLLAENLITMHTADVFLRIIAMISAPDDSTVLSANEFISNIEKGKLSTIAEGKFFEGVKLQSPPSNNGSYLTQFIEYHQYFLGSFFNEIGLNANFNMKRESIAKSESSLNEDSMLPLCQNMLMCRQQDFDVVNEMFGLNIKVTFDSAWLQNALEVVMALESMKKEAMGAGVQGAGVQAGDTGAQAGYSNSQKGEDGDEAADEDQGEENSGVDSESNIIDSESLGRSGDSGEPTDDPGEAEEEAKSEEVERLIIQAAGLQEDITVEEKKDDGDADDSENPNSDTGDMGSDTDSSDKE